MVVADASPSGVRPNTSTSEHPGASTEGLKALAAMKQPEIWNSASTASGSIDLSLLIWVSELRMYPKP